jgi:uncharacterized membrane protein
LNIKFKTIFIISFILIIVLLVDWNLNLTANNLDDQIKSASTIRSNVHPREVDIDWGKIEVISESIPNQDINNGDSSAATIAVENDKIYVVWVDGTDYNGAGGDLDIFYRYFDGNTWSNIQIISEPVDGFNYNTQESLNPDIAIENGKIYIIWDDQNDTNGASTDSDIFFRCNLTGNSWEDIQVISEPDPGQNLNIGSSYRSKITVENGKIHVVWNDNNNTNNAGSDNDIFYRCNLTDSNWEDIQVISEPIENMNFNIAFSGTPDFDVENGNIYIVWQDNNNTNNGGIDTDIFYRCKLTGNNWGNIQVISEPILGWNFNIGGDGYPSLAVWKGNIYITWISDNNTDDAGTDYDIFYRCNLNGNSWENIQIISEPIFKRDNNIGNSFYPDIALENGKIHIVWHDDNNTNKAGTDLDILYRCNITGANWEDIQVISEPIIGKNINTETSSFPNIVTNLGKNYIIWIDTNNSKGSGFDSDVFYRHLYSPVYLEFPSLTPILGNTSTNYKFRVSYFHLNNISPTRINVIIDGNEYLMLENDPIDTNYLDGKNYSFTINNLYIGLHKFQFYASDSKFYKLTKLVNKPIVYNTPPRISIKNNLTAIEDVYYIVNYEFEDIDIVNIGQSVTFSNFSTNANWLDFDYYMGKLSGTPTNDDVGEYWVNISIDDTIDIDFSNFTLTVINTNDAPIILTNDTTNINEDEFYNINYEALDVDTPQNNLNWFMSTNASWLEFDQKSGTLSGIPENNDVGEFWVNISVSDYEYIDFSNFTLKVINVNDPPKIITNEILVAYEDNYYEMSFKAEDVDNTQNKITWMINTNAQWLSVNNINSIINGTPMNDDVGDYWVNVSITDGEYNNNSNFTLKVKNVNDPPKIIVKDKTIAIIGELYSINYDVIDIDPLPNSFIWTIKSNASEWLSIETTSGLLIGEPSENDIGSYWINVSVSDEEGGWDHHNFTLEVHKSPTKGKNNPDSSFISTETFYGLIWIIIIIVILTSIIIIFTLKKQKKEIIHILEKREIELIQTVKAELLQTTPSHILLSAETSQEGKMTLPDKPVVIAQLPPKPVDQTQPTVAVKTEEQPINAIGTVPIPQQYQLPKATLSEEQQLNLLRERFLKGEVTEEIYNKLRSEIETDTVENFTKDESEISESTDVQPNLLQILQQPTTQIKQNNKSEECKNTQIHSNIQSQPSIQKQQQKSNVQRQNNKHEMNN